MFEILHHAMQMKAHMTDAAHAKAHLTSLLPEEDNHEYVQEHDTGMCTQFQVLP